MWGLFVTLFTSVLVLYLVSYGLVLKYHYETMKELWGSKPVYRGFFLSNSTDLNSADLQYLVMGDVDVKRDNCMQAVAQICLTLSLECNNNRNALDVWGWAIAAVAPDNSVLDSADYEEVDFVVRLKGSGYVDLERIPAGSAASGCGRSQLISRGAYYYNSIVRALGCDEFGLDLNGVRTDGNVHPCLYVDTLRYK